MSKPSYGVLMHVHQGRIKSEQGMSTNTTTICFWIYFSEISSPSTTTGFFLTEPTPSSRHICHLHLSAITRCRGEAQAMPTGKFLPSGLWTTEESWFNSQNALAVFSAAIGLALGFTQLVMEAKWFHSVRKQQMRGVITPLRQMSSGNCIK